MAKLKARGAGEGSIFQRKDGRWCGQIDLGWQNGKRARKLIYGKTAAEVQEALLKARADRAAGLPIAVERQNVEQFLTRWIDRSVRPSVRPLTLEQYEQHVRLYLTPAFGRLPLAKLHSAEIQDFIARQLLKGLSARTVRLSLFVLRRACAQAVKWHTLARNPVDDVDLPPAGRVPVRTFTEVQARTLLTTVRGDPAEPALMLALLCGLRRGELLALDWKGIDFEAGTLSITRALNRVGEKLVFSEPKSTSGRRTIPLPSPVLRALKSHRARQAESRLALGQAYEDNNLLFPNGVGRPLEPRAFNRQFKDALLRAGLPCSLRLHDCRHFAATTMIADGTDVRTVAGLLGHSDPSLTLRTYAHAVPEAARRATDRMGLLIDPIGEATTK